MCSPRTTFTSKTFRSLALTALFLAVVSAPAHAQPCSPALAASTFTPACPSLSSCPGRIVTLKSYDDGSGAGELFYAGGSAGTIGSVARLTASGWERVGAGLIGSVNAFGLVADGLGPGGRPSFYAGGSFPGSLARWTGTQWELFPVNPLQVHAIVGLDDDTGHAILYVLAGPPAAPHLRRWSAASGAWETVGTFSTIGYWYNRVVSFDEDGAGPLRPAIYFTSGPGIRSLTDARFPSTQIDLPSGVVKWDGLNFIPLPSTNFGPWFKSIEVYDDGRGGGRALYVAGRGQAPLGTVLKWDSTSQDWVRPGPERSSFGDPPFGMAVVADGLSPGGSRLYGVTGTTGLNITTPSSINAAFDGLAWSGIQAPANTNLTFLTYHIPAAGGHLGTARVPALLYITEWLGGFTTFAAVLGCPRCRADVDLDGSITIGDIFLFLDGFFTRAGAADFNQTNGVTLQDLFDFLAAFFTGC
jgi:hypothetical protein